MYLWLKYICYFIGNQKTYRAVITSLNELNNSWNRRWNKFVHHFLFQFIFFLIHHTYNVLHSFPFYDSFHCVHWNKLIIIIITSCCSFYSIDVQGMEHCMANVYLLIQDCETGVLFMWRMSFRRNFDANIHIRTFVG